MSVAEAQRQDTTASRPVPSAIGRLARRLWRLVVLATFALAVAFVAGFLWFVASVPTEEVTIDRPADGIVVLTGGASRITDAIELLAAGRGKRLLISGVHPTTSSSELARLSPAYRRWMTCCVDLGHAAINTTGNAIETRQWVTERGFRSVIVVTSNYHMPRTMAELRRRMPDVALVPFPVVTDKMRDEAWWSSPPTTKLLFSEYLKYIVAQVRFRLGTVPSAASVPIPKFAQICRTLGCELRNRRTLANYDSSAALNPKFATGLAAMLCELRVRGTSISGLRAA